MIGLNQKAGKGAISNAPKLTTRLLAMVIFLLCANCSFSQIIDESFEEPEWSINAANSTSGNVVLTATSVSRPLTYYTVQNGTPTSSSLNTTPNSGTWWYSRLSSSTDNRMNKIRSISHSLGMSPGGYIITPITKSAFVSVTFWAALATPIAVGVNTNTNAVQGSFNSSTTGTALAAIGFTYATQSFSAGANSSLTSYSFTGSFSGPARIGFFSIGGSNIYIDDIVVMPPLGTPPTVTTNTVTPGQATALVNATVTPGTMPLRSSGIIWSSSNTLIDTTLATKTVDVPAATSTYNGTATGLTPGTCYYARAYVIGIDGSVAYGTILPFCTNPPVAPTLITVTPFNVLSYKASSGGSNIDSGGLTITQKGVVWSTSPNPTIALPTLTKEGPNGSSFSSVMRTLAPSTTYYVRAYATNSLGTGYGNELSFTTPGPVPALVANPASLNFGTITFNGYSPVLSYALTGHDLSPSAGSILVTAPAGFTISLSPNGSFAASLNLLYASNALAPTNIYVKLSTANYGTFGGSITNIGGGATPANSDSVLVTGTVIPDPTTTTNVGTDFWTGFGYQEKMSQVAGNSGEAKLSLYISVPSNSQSANVTVELPGIPGAAGFPKTVTVAPGTVTEVKDFPTGDPGNRYNPTGLPDTRLYATGVTSRGIHVSSNNGIPISVWTHSYTNANSAAGAMLFPTNTWNNAYTVQAYGGNSNNSNPNSFFFVVASENNTPIWFTPGNDILDSSTATLFTDNHTAANVKYQKGVRYGPIYLNKGQIFNAMGKIEGSGSGVGAGRAFGLDLSGSKVETTCDKKIAVFGGNGRCLINAAGCTASSGSDHLIQQMFPSVAWGTKYLTVPTKTMEYNLYRINVNDPSTQVWVNNAAHTTPLTNLINNLYYEVATSQPLMIESSKPVSVTQFIVAGGCANQNGSKGNGDPEMIILSPVQQAINSATVYSARMKLATATYNGHYINVVIRKGGIPSFRLDGAAVADTGINQTTANANTCYNTGGTIPITNAFVKHPGDSNYYFAKLRVLPGASHQIYSDSIFNAIAYGMGDGESYGYSAGTNIKDLSKPLLIDNPFGSNTANTSCKNNPIRLRAVLPYPPAQVTKIEWFMSQVTGLNRNDTTINNPIPDSTYVIDGITYYVYTNPNFYVFPSAGTYRITGLVTGTFASACGSTSPLDFTITVIGDNDFQPDFSFAYNGCVSDTVKFTDKTIAPQYAPVKWLWNFGDTKTDTVQHPAHVYNPTGIYTIKLRVVNNIGCYADTSKIIDQTMILTAKFNVPDTICAKSTVRFTDSSNSSVTIVKWYWDFGDGAKDTLTTNAPRDHVYDAPGTYTISLTVKNDSGCINTYTKIITIRPVPFANLNMPAGICLPSGLTQFTNLSTLTPTGPMTYNWLFGDGGTDTITNPLHTYTSTGPFTIKLTATSSFGCTKDTSRVLSTVYAQPKAGFTVAPENCLRDTTYFTDTSNGSGNTIVKWYWNFGDNKIDSVKNPKHVYAAAGNYTVMLVVSTDKGCVSDTFKTTITINALPAADFTFSTIRCAKQPVTFTPQVLSGTVTHWLWSFGNGQQKDTVNIGPFTINYTNAGSYNVSLVVVDAKGCKSDSVKKVVVINPNPSVGFTIANTCFGDAFTQFNDTATNDATQAPFTWTWNFGDANANAGNPNASTTQNPKHTYIATGTYNVSLTMVSANSCSTSVTRLVVINPKPLASFVPPIGICLPRADAQFFDSSTIADGTESLFQYDWVFGDLNDPTKKFTKDPIHTYTSSGPFNITLTVTSNKGCKDDTTIMLSEVSPQPRAGFFPTPDTVCLGDDIAFTDTSKGLSSAVVKWMWNFIDGSYDTTANPVHIYTTAGRYNVTLSIVNSDGCFSDTASRIVSVNDYPVVELGPTKFVLQNHSLTLMPQVTGTDLQFLWEPATYLNSNTIQNPTCSPLNDILYKLTVTGQGGCDSWDTVTVKIWKDLQIPNVFSPNGDNINDKWVIGFLDTYPGATVEVFNRYGQRVHSSIGKSSESWDGTMNGKALPVGTYYYIIDAKNGREPVAGSVTILK